MCGSLQCQMGTRYPIVAGMDQMYSRTLVSMAGREFECKWVYQIIRHSSSDMTSNTISYLFIIQRFKDYERNRGGGGSTRFRDRSWRDSLRQQSGMLIYERENVHTSLTILILLLRHLPWHFNLYRFASIRRAVAFIRTSSDPSVRAITSPWIVPVTESAPISTRAFAIPAGRVTTVQRKPTTVTYVVKRNHPKITPSPWPELLRRPMASLPKNQKRKPATAKPLRTVSHSFFYQTLSLSMSFTRLKVDLKSNSTIFLYIYVNLYMCKTLAG